MQVQSALRHAVAGAIVLCATIAFTLLSYLGLLTWAVLMGEPIGGALALPFMLFVALVGGCVSVVLVLFPSTLLSHLVCQAMKWPLLAEIPIATVISIVLSAILGAVGGGLFATVDQGIRSV